MKKIALVVILVVMILSFGVVEQVFITKTFDELERKAVAIYTTLKTEDYSHALQLTQDMIEWWQKKRDWLEFLCPNYEVKEIIREMAELEGSQLAEMYDDSITRANILKTMAQNSRNLLEFNWKNVL